MFRVEAQGGSRAQEWIWGGGGGGGGALLLF